MIRSMGNKFFLKPVNLIPLEPSQFGLRESPFHKSPEVRGQVVRAEGQPRPRNNSPWIQEVKDRIPHFNLYNSKRSKLIGDTPFGGGKYGIFGGHFAPWAERR